MSVGFLTPLLLSLAAVVVVHGQLQTGYISIDCGSPENFNFVDIDTGISYSSDGAYIDTGINKNISSQYAYPNNPNLPQPLSDLRSFPHGNKNCYTLAPAAGKRGLFLIRASFLYGNYDGDDKLPEFDLYLDVNLWSSVKFSNASDEVTTEIISAAVSETISVCLVNKGLGIPFISALELRPLSSSIYGTELGNTVSLVLFKRLDIGYTNGTGRYKDDIYDRIWSPYYSPSWNIVSTFSAINSNENGYKAPLEVMSTAAMPRNGSDQLELSWTADADASKFYVYMYFAEFQRLEKNQTRKFNISWNGSLMFGPFVPRFLYAVTISNSEAFTGKEHRISIHKTGDATLPPILNAIEIYTAKQLDELPTFSEDVDAVLDIKRTYQVNKGWVGDPCGPKNYTWEGVECNYSVSLPPRIISLNLTSSGLSGTISASFGNLSSVESLDLSNNRLSGPVPEFLKELKSLKFLNLEGNQLSGYVPTELLERSKAGFLNLRVDEQNLCSSGSCKNKKKIVVPIVASVLSALMVSVGFIMLWRLRRKRKSNADASNGEGRPLPSKNRQFTYAEVLNITSNFQDVIGKGGFGNVYRGHMKDGTQVAVKMLSPSSTQGSKEFQTEAELLMRVHHRNLASFIGYCDDGSNMALIYEYMANGNLKDYLSYKNSNRLSWEMRLRIAIDAAQGLEYLHHGCKPPIIHRDVKTANILLSENMDAKIADFGLSKAFPNDSHSHVITTVMGTTGYLDPEYYNSRKLNEKSDVFSFGVVLLELITGQHAIIKKDESIHIVHWVSPLIESGDIGSIVDQRLHGEFDANSVWKALEVAVACTTPTSFNRASMSLVLTELKQCLAMELSHNRERRQGFSEVIYNIGPYNSPEVYSLSTATESITSPSAR
ncbi:probable LRR receptor-like serine/threonine-protein kinase At4g29180 isoform X2 [Durio zibethinus]|uniref:non-specific serine/threonine protein kinase n=1 Tax=Durio zibethinus TaxID=66656 RepID=A0A6P5XSF4_DURZI|nr:probable LRR receptor-like serine/threonine-protein kinase At4g29180 isoform X2 [Durio zibethinus]